MNPMTKRIYVGNLPFDTTESEVTKKFSRYGNVLALELKHRSDVGLPCYAFLDLETDDVESCFKKLLRKKWNGHSIKLELAKESFLSRLEKERVNDASHPVNITGTAPVPDYVAHQTTDVSHVHSIKNGTKQRKNDKCELNCLNSDILDEFKPTIVTSKNDSPSVNTTTILDKLETYSDVWKDPPSSQPSKTNVDVTGRKRKESFKNDLSEEKLKVQRNLISEEKRLKSLEEKKKSFLQQKEAVKLALSSVDINRKASNKLIFDDDDDEIVSPVARNQYDSTNSNQQSNNIVQGSHGTKKKQSLFDDDDDEPASEEVQEKDFQIKRQFEGGKGQKLLQLQSQYANDQRFALDERFYESDENADEDGPSNKVSGTDEMKRQLEILQSIVGHELPRVPERKNNLKGVDNFMLRFDPTIADHVQYETKEPEIEPVVVLPTKKSKKKKVAVTETKDADVPCATVATNVSKEKFYKVADTLKESLKTKESSGFSLLEMFGSKVDKETSEKEKDVQLSVLPLINDKQGWTSNPFKYDSSESESEDVPESTKPIVAPTSQNQDLPVQAKGLWRENFFFKTNDTRLTEGLEFFAIRKNVEEDFRVRRRELQQIVSAKVKHNLRKSAPKKKMLGGNKFKRRGRK